MGFYAPAQIVRDAREHDVDVHAADANLSDWDNILEPPNKGHHAVRIDLRQIVGLGREEREALMPAHDSDYDPPEAIRRRSGIARRSLECAVVDAFRSMQFDRREALWSARGETPRKMLPLFAAADIIEQAPDPLVKLPTMPLSEHVTQDYQTTRLTLLQYEMSLKRGRDFNIKRTRNYDEIRS